MFRDVGKSRNSSAPAGSTVGAGPGPASESLKPAARRCSTVVPASETEAVVSASETEEAPGGSLRHASGFAALPALAPRARFLPVFLVPLLLLALSLPAVAFCLLLRLTVLLLRRGALLRLRAGRARRQRAEDECRADEFEHDAPFTLGTLSNRGHGGERCNDIALRDARQQGRHPEQAFLKALLQQRL